MLRVVDLESEKQQQNTSCFDKIYRFFLNTNLSENSEITAETSRMGNSEISFQMSKKLEEVKSVLNSHILEVINSAIEEKILPSIENAAASNEAAKTTKWDLRSDGRHPSKADQTTLKFDPKSQILQKNKLNQLTQDSRGDLPRLIATSSNQNNHYSEILVDSDQSDEDGYDI